MAVVITIGPLLAVFFLILLIIIALKFGEYLMIAVWNSIIGLILLWLLNFLPFFNIKISIWTILIVAIAGIPGVALIALLNLFGIVV